jgi:hypothetical protein
MSQSWSCHPKANKQQQQQQSQEILKEKGQYRCIFFEFQEVQGSLWNYKRKMGTKEYEPEVHVKDKPWLTLQIYHQLVSF